MFIFVSDVHLNEPHSKRYGAFLHLLDELKDDKSIKEVFLVGDIFDLWLGDREIFKNMHKSVLKKIENLAKFKVVHYFEGNHDFHLGKFWKDMGVRVYPGEYEFNLNGKRVLIGHGDLLDQDDKNYLKMRWIFRTSFIKMLIKIVPQCVLFKINTVLNTTEQKSSLTKEQEKTFLNKWEEWTKALYKRKPYDIFICGHYHIKADIILKNFNARAVNLGTWLDGEFSVFEL